MKAQGQTPVPREPGLAPGGGAKEQGRGGDQRAAATEISGTLERRPGGGGDPASKSLWALTEDWAGKAPVSNSAAENWFFV